MRKELGLAVLILVVTPARLIITIGHGSSSSCGWRRSNPRAKAEVPGNINEFRYYVPEPDRFQARVSAGSSGEDPRCRSRSDVRKRQRRSTRDRGGTRIERRHGGCNCDRRKEIVA